VDGTSTTQTITGHDGEQLWWGVKADNAPNGASWSTLQFKVNGGGGSGGTCPSSSPTADQIYLYQDNHTGKCVWKGVGDFRNGGEIGLDGISSIKVGSNVVAMLCGADDFAAPCSAFLTDSPGFDGRVIQNDHVFSVRVQSRAGRYDSQDSNRWFAEYYPNVSFNGDPMARKNEGSADLPHDGDWQGNGPGYGVPAGHFASRFRRTVNFDCGKYTFLFSYDDGGRVFVDGQSRYNDWADGVHTQRPFTLDLSAGTHEIQVEQYDSNGWAKVALSWQLTTPCPALPSSPALASPANGQRFAEGQEITLCWSATGDQYYGEITGGPAGTLTFGWQAGTCKNIGSQWAGYTYSWRVKARNGAGESSWSNSWTFTVRANQPPIANAGPDQTVTDADGDGFAQVTLNGSASSDPDGDSLTFVWTDGSTELQPHAATITVPLSVGTHTIQLYVGDPDLASDTDDVRITVNPMPSGQAVTLKLEVGIYDLTDPYPTYTAYGPYAPSHLDRQLNVQVVGDANTVVSTVDVAARYDATRKAYIANALVHLEPGTYLVKVKLSNTLRRTQVGLFTVTSTTTSVTIPRIVTMIGDVDGNNRVDLNDYNILYGCYSVLGPPKSCSAQYLPGAGGEPTTDLDDDGDVDQGDLNLILRKFQNLLGD
jgi:hypothetical protein